MVSAAGIGRFANVAAHARFIRLTTNFFIATGVIEAEMRRRGRDQAPVYLELTPVT